MSLLLGAALAMVWPTQISRLTLRRSVRSPLGLDVAGTVGLLGIFALVAEISSLSSFLYPTGIILPVVATVLVIAAVVNPSSLLGELLGCPPLRWIGVRSYGIYLWHWPIIVLGLAGDRLHWPGAALQVALTFVVASLSWRYVEELDRQGVIGRLRRRPRTCSLRSAGAAAYSASRRRSPPRSRW